MGVIVSRWARLANSGTTPPNSACRSIWLATTEERTARGVIDHGGRRLVTRRLDGQQRPGHRASASAAAIVGPRDGPFALDHRLGARVHVDQRRGDVLERPAVDDEVDGGAETGRHVLRRARRGRAVRVGARDDEDAGPLEQRTAGSRGRGCARPPPPVRPARPAGRAPARSRRRESAAPATSAGPRRRRRRVNATPSARTCDRGAPGRGGACPRAGPWPGRRHAPRRRRRAGRPTRRRCRSGPRRRRRPAGPPQRSRAPSSSAAPILIARLTVVCGATGGAVRAGAGGR